MQNMYAGQRSQPISLSANTQGATYGLFTVAMGVTLLGVYLGMGFSSILLTSGMHVLFAVAELALVFTAGWWVNKRPLNMVLFLLFPLLSGFTLTPYLLMVLSRFDNGSAILFNAVLATVFMSLAAAAFARTVPSLAGFGRALLIGLIGLIVLSLVQFFVPALRTQTFELLISGAGIVLFGAFTAFDLQRISEAGKAGANPFLLALSLYLDIFNLFLMVLRFMSALSGERR